MLVPLAADPAPPEIALLADNAPSDVFEMLCLLVEGRLQREITSLPAHPVQPYDPRGWAWLRRTLKNKVVARLHSVLVPQSQTVVRHDIHSQDFLRYVLRHRPNLPIVLFPAEDHRRLRHFAINKLLFGTVRVFETAELYPEEFGTARQQFEAKVKAGANHPEANGFISFGFRTREAFSEFTDFGALSAHYGLEEFGPQVPAGAVLDVGPYIGDSSFAFATRLPGRRILCLEPDSINRKKLIENIALNRLSSAEVIEKGAGAERVRVRIAQPGTAGSTVQAGSIGEHFFDVDTIDNIVRECAVERVGLMKFDIEGQEANALAGARGTITRDRPMLIVAAYHRGADIFEIPQMLSQWVPSYEFYFRHLDPRFPCSEYVIIAVERAAGSD